MKMSLYSQGFVLPGEVDRYVRRRMQDALRPYQNAIGDVEVTLRALSEPDEPEQYNVVVRLELHKRDGVIVEGNGCDLYVTTRYVATRAQDATQRAVDLDLPAFGDFVFD